MLITLTRGLILYVMIAACMRFMGKRQLGELQPTELVITLLLSEIAAVPMENNETPMMHSLLAVSLLVCLEVLNSVLVMKSPFLRYRLQGKPVTIIRDGVLDQKMLRELRLTADDVLDQLRQKDVFDISEVAFAVIETNGSLSIKKKPKYETPTLMDLGLKPQPQSVPVLAVNDGKYMENFIAEAGIARQDVDRVLKKENVRVGQVLLLLLDPNGKYTLIRKEQT